MLTIVMDVINYALVLMWIAMVGIAIVQSLLEKLPRKKSEDKTEDGSELIQKREPSVGGTDGTIDIAKEFFGFALFLLINIVFLLIGIWLHVKG